MSIVVRYTPTNLTTDMYDESVRQLEQGGEWPPEGLEYHVFFGEEGSLRVSEIWSSREQWQAFGERMMPILTAIGIEFSGAPEIYDVHNTVAR